MNKYFLSAILLLLLNTASAQSTVDFKVKKAGPITREFLYQGKPISPEALIKMFPTIEEESGIDTVDLKKYPYTNAVKHDSIYHSRWKQDYQQKRSYYMEIRYNDNLYNYSANSKEYEAATGLVSYIVLGNTSGGKFIVLAYLDTWMVHVFILDIKNDKLIKLGEVFKPLETDALPDPAVIIQSDTINWGSTRYPIPSSAR